MSYIGFLSSLSPSFVVCGDFNIHVDSASPSVCEFKSMIDACFLTQYIDFPTHLHGHTLDLLLAPTELSGISEVHGSCFISDHKIISCSVDFPCVSKHHDKIVTFRQYHKINVERLREDLAASAFVAHPSDDIDTLYEQYVSSLSDLLDIHAPLKTRRLAKPAPGWITNEFRTAKCLRRQYERTWRRDKTPLNRACLRWQINRCNHLLNKNKKNYYQELVKENSKDGKKLWRVLGKVLGRSQVSILPSCTDDKSLANRFGSFFIDKINKIRNTFRKCTSKCVPQERKPPSFSSFQLVSELEVHKFIKDSPSKTCSLDPWPTFLVKRCIDILLPSITKLVNLSLQDGVFPEPFKIAIVTPLIKKTSLPKDDLKNYRPVSGLSFLSKLVERVVASQIRSHIDSNNLGNTFQSAYKAGHSTETALLCIQNEIHLSLSKGMPTALVLLDLSAAFDTIDHDTLLACLSTRFGFTGYVLRWFTSYLLDRFQSVKIGSVVSECFKLNFGVPQGSVLGPLLFSLYTSPLSNVIAKFKDVKYHFYADDSQSFIHLSPGSCPNSFHQLKACLDEIRMWMFENKLKLNPGKTEFIVFGSMDKFKWLKDSLPVNILGNCLSPNDVVRNLGVLFDSKFSFTNHVNSVVKSSFTSLRDLHRIRRFLSYDVSIMVANALVSSRLDYCNSLFRSLSSKNITRLQNIQNCLARFVSGVSRFSHVSPILKSLHWLPVQQRIIFKTLLLTYKFLTTGKPKYFAPYLSLYTSAVKTRRSNPEKMFLNVPFYSSSVHKSKVHFNKSFSYDAPKLWNDLPLEIRTAPKLSCFKRRLKTYLFQKSFPP